MHDSLAVAAFLDPSILRWKEYYVDVETAGELTAGETVGYSPAAGDDSRRPDMGKQGTMNMPIRGSAPYSWQHQNISAFAGSIYPQCQGGYGR